MLGHKTASALAAELRSGRLDPVDLLAAVFARIDAVADPAIFTEILHPRAEACAQAARVRLRAGAPASPLDGVPIGWKDLFDLKGRTTTAGSVVLQSTAPAAEDAAIVQAAQRGGLISVGALNMTEFAYSGIGMNPHYGTPINPHGAGGPHGPRVPGGSSSGSGVAVARRILPLAFGTDTGGSVRIPAAFNGIVGYKASTRRYAMAGVFPLSRTLDSLGPLAQSVEDCMLIDAVIRGEAAQTPRPAHIEDLDFVIPDAVMFESAQPAVVANFNAAAARLQAAGARVRPIKLPQLREIQDLIAETAVLGAVEALELHWDRLHGAQAAQMDARVVSRMLAAQSISAVKLVTLLRERVRLIADVTQRLGGALLICPTTPEVAMPLAPLAANPAVFFHHNALALRNTSLGNFLDWCGLSIPSGTDGDGMPTGFMICAAHGADKHVLAAGLCTEPLIRGSGT